MVGPVQATGMPPGSVTELLSRETQQESSLASVNRFVRELFEDQVHLTSGGGMTVEPRLTGIRFQPYDNPRVIQARVVDERTNETIREVPTTQRLQFVKRFREAAAQFLGHYLDTRA